MSVEQAEILIERVDELVTVVGNIQGYCIFGVTVILMIYAYKFFRMFF